MRILSQQFFPRGSLLRPAETDAIRRCDRIPLVYRVLDGDGRAIEELPGYALSMEVMLAKPDGGSALVAMEFDRQLGTGTFRSTQELVCERDGRYWTDARITAIDARGQRLDVFRDRWSGFTVMSGDCRPRAVAAATRERAMSRAFSKNLSLAVLLAVAIAGGTWIVRKTKS